MASPYRNTSRTAFSLIELSVIILIVALLAGSTLILGSKRIEQQRVYSTKERLDLIERALYHYAELNGRLPCPASFYHTPSSPHYGLESQPRGNCMEGDIIASHQHEHIVSGAVPVRALALPDAFMRDNWHRKITYTVDRRFTRPDALRLSGQSCNCGSIVVQDEHGSEIIRHGMFILLSHGIDGHGAYQRIADSIRRHNSGNAYAGSLQNAGLTPDFNSHFTGSYYSRGYFVAPDNPANRFDDILLTRSRKDWSLSYDRTATAPDTAPATEAGWVYIPSHTLPDGTHVPGFEMMKYEAADPNGVGGNNLPGVGGRGQPVSSPHLTPWTHISYQNARAACQSLSNSGATSGQGAPMGYDIISESQWLSVAHQLITDSRNWTSGFVHDGVLISGHSDNSPSAALDASDDDSNGYYKTQNHQGQSTNPAALAQRRTFHLPHGGVIWDFAGNVAEYSYCDLGALCHTPDRKRGIVRLSHFTNHQRSANGTYNYHSHLTRDNVIDAILPPHPYSTALRTGTLHHTTGNQSGIILRGGSFGNAPQSGLFSWASASESTATAHTGFRCVRNHYGNSAEPDNISGLEIWYDASDIDGNFSEDWGESGINEEGLRISGSACPTATPCVEVWRNKAGNNRYHARSRRLNGIASGTDANRPTLHRGAINGRPAVNFSAHTPQWLDTHHNISDGADDGKGYMLNNISEFTFFVVANASRYDAIIAATDANPLWWPHFVLFPYNIGHVKPYNDYVLLIDNFMGGKDAGNNYCRMNSALLHPLDLLCLPDPLPLNQRNYACARMGGIDTPHNGLTHNSPHVATAIFRRGAENGLSAYVDGGPSHPQHSSVQPDNNRIGGDMCLLNALLRLVELKVNIGMNRHDMTTRTVGDVAEILVYNRALGNHERVMVEKYLSNKYNIEYKGPQRAP